ncbi:MAG: 3'-5' exonuclease [Candidatus Doudnabacteria bacterium]
MAVREFDNCICVIDTETVPAEDKFFFNFSEPFPTIESVGEHGSLKDPIKIDEWKKTKLISLIDDWKKAKQKASDEAEKAWRTQALESYVGRIIVLCYAKNDGDVIKLDSSKGEKEMLMEFYEDIKRYKTINFVGHNLAFDLKFIAHRAIHYKLMELVNIIRLDKGWTKGRDFCTQEMAFFGLEWKGKISLHNLCKLLGVPTSKDDINGSEVLDAYLRGEIERIKTYCAKDVDRTRKCFYILK